MVPLKKNKSWESPLKEICITARGCRTEIETMSGIMSYLMQSGIIARFGVHAVYDGLEFFTLCTSYSTYLK